MPKTVQQAKTVVAYMLTRSSPRSRMHRFMQIHAQHATAGVSLSVQAMTRKPTALHVSRPAERGEMVAAPSSEEGFARAITAKYILRVAGQRSVAACAKEVHQHLNSSFEAENCTATDGGGIHLSRPDNILGSASRASFHQREQSSARFGYCRAEKRGGGLNVEDDFLQGFDSWLHADQCVATHGGGVFIGGSLSQTEHSLARFTSCSAKETGGGVWSADVHQEDHSSAILKNCSAKEGGGIFVNASFYQLGHSSSRFTSCSAELFGGGLRVRGDLIQNTSSQLHAEDCFARAGGGLFVTSFSQEQDSQAEFENCTAVRDGGGMFADATFAQGAGGHTRFERCTALQQAGGGLSARTLFSNGSIHFRSCSADKGGGLHVQDDGKLHCGGALLFQDCAATASGGGILSEAGEEQAIANLSFERCRARAASALMMTSSSTDLQLKQLFMTDNTGNDGVDIIAAGSIAIEAAHFHSQSGGVQIETAQSLRLDDVLDCTNVSSCTFRAKTAHVAGFRCPVGTGVGSGISSLDQGCLVCAEGYTQVLFGSSEPCLHCPDKARQCFASHFEMQSGTMVEHTNVSRSFHCPNEAACPGGQLPGGTPMCAEGYNGPGCVGCTTGHAKADSSVLSCTRCSDERLVQASQWMLFLSQRMLLFGLTATSAGAKSAGDLKESSIYLNQLMAFATISTMVFTAVMQTNTAKDLKSNAITFLFGAAMVVADTGSGQGSVGFASSQCLLSYIGFQQTLGGSHMLDMTVAAVLVVILSLVKDHRVALAAGLNCFLPSIVADFGKYMVCYRLEPDDGSGLERLHCPFLPEGSKGAGFVQVCAGLVLFLTVALLAWVRLSMSKELPPPSHVVFLTGKYKETYALFEMERLVRKTLLTFIGAMLPIASAPALQMGCLGAVVFSSLLLYGAAQPYHTPAWNRSEIALLATATYMIMVSGLLANEFHWGHSVATQQFIIVSTMILGGVVSSYMSFRVFQELIVEQTRAVSRESKG
ncbi:pmpB [Symbiodinium sp. CCMP2456]|nr:pmpB [Symbiodinium sp. CCMP2456]